MRYRRLGWSWGSPTKHPKNASSKRFSLPETIFMQNTQQNTQFIPRSHKRLEIIKRDCPSKLKLFEAVYAGKATRNQCIKAQCLDCMGLDQVAVRECGDRLCPLHKYRPFQRRLQ